MVAQPTGVDARGHEVMAEGVHFDQRCHANGITKVVGVYAPSQAGAGHWFRGQETGVQALFAGFADKGENQSCHIAATTCAANHHVRVSSASAICFRASSPIIVWCIRTWLSTLPREYLTVPPLVAATSTASLMAMPRLPWLSGSCARMLRPALVRLLGLAWMAAP